MKYSFVLIAFNEAENIATCVASIDRQLSLDDDYEILVVDDGSTDSTPSVVQKICQDAPHVRLITDGANHGRGFGRWRGVNESVGDYIIMVDADIVLPPEWLATTLPYLQNYDMAGGTAVPDGDVAYLYRRFNLRPKTVRNSTVVTGSNGIYHRRVFDTVNFDPVLREGEDVDFNHRSSAAGFTSICVPGLTVEHQERKSFPRSMQWLFQSGVGATRQLVRFRQIRLPDVAFGGTFVAVVAATVASATHGWRWPFALPGLGVGGVAFLHVHGKFHLSIKRLPDSLGAWLTDCLLIACYYVGRVAGVAPLLKRLVVRDSRETSTEAAQQRS
ncbi:MAG: glycosyltransferase [Microlunatus sp.]